VVVGELPTSTDLLVIGGGPGGYTAAIRAAQLGLNVILVERENLGGVCLNHGCIPSKALIHAANLYHDMNNSRELGITATANINLKQLQEWKRSVVEKLTGGIAYLLKKHGVEVIQGEAYFESSTKAGISGQSSVEFKHAIIATGTTPKGYPNFEYDGIHIISSKEALALTELPEQLLIIGAGYISIELGTVYAKLGSRVSIVQRSPHILSRIPLELSNIVEKRLKELGVTLHLETKPLEWQPWEGRCKVTLQGKDETITEEADKILIAVGVQPATDKLHLENTSVTLNQQGYIEVNQQLQTSDPHIYAIGDVTGPPLLAHKAYRQAKVTAEVIAGAPSAFDNTTIPTVIYSDPEIAITGISEEKAKAQGYNIKIDKFPLKHHGRALTMNKTTGFIKTIMDMDTNTLLGMQIIGAHASDLISEATLVIEMGAQLDDVALTIHPHPTMSEAISEAVEKALGRAIHTTN
jgi:dihydrolipoamide dehydrogenase